MKLDLLLKNNFTPITSTHLLLQTGNILANNLISYIKVKFLTYLERSVAR